MCIVDNLDNAGKLQEESFSRDMSTPKQSVNTCMYFCSQGWRRKCISSFFLKYKHLMCEPLHISGKVLCQTVGSSFTVRDELQSPDPGWNPRGGRNRRSGTVETSWWWEALWAPAWHLELIAAFQLRATCWTWAGADGTLGQRCSGASPWCGMWLRCGFVLLILAPTIDSPQPLQIRFLLTSAG